MSTMSTHVLDVSIGKPAHGVGVTLERGGMVIGTGVTDADGRVKDLAGAAPLDVGDYRLIFDIADYFTTSGRESFYPEIVVTFRVKDRNEHYHVPLLLSPFGYSTYRGS